MWRVTLTSRVCVSLDLVGKHAIVSDIHLFKLKRVFKNDYRLQMKFGAG